MRVCDVGSDFFGVLRKQLNKHKSERLGDARLLKGTVNLRLCNNPTEQGQVLIHKQFAVFKNVSVSENQGDIISSIVIKLSQSLLSKHSVSRKCFRYI